jgi:thiamine pyrophosphate-dependent acetolactate synthase large subunit-like protein
VARSAKIKTFKVGTKSDLIKKLEKTKKLTGPILILVKISKSKKTSKRVNIEPTKIKLRFMESLRN